VVTASISGVPSPGRVAKSWQEKIELAPIAEHVAGEWRDEAKFGD